MANQQQVVETLKAHPDWSSTEIAAHLDCMSGYVRATIRRCGMRLARESGQHVPGGSIINLGRACRDAGITLADIKKIARSF